ncbi:MAG: aminodeoxychorismate synthase component I [Gammaproteobacteria bacterium]
MILEISYHNPLDLFALFATENGAIFLESVELRANCGRYSFIAIDPFLLLTSKNGETQLNEKKIIGNPFDLLAQEIAKYPLERQENLPPFQGGAAGFFGYELAKYLEKLPAEKKDELQFPEMAVGFYDLVIGFDELEKRAWIFSSGYPEQEKKSREDRAKLRIDWFLNRIIQATELPALANNFCEEKNIQSNFTCANYLQAVQRVIDYILQGDIFEANISQRFQATLPLDSAPFDLYRKLRSLNAAPFAAFINMAETVIASASPERFLRLMQNNIEARPIKGTRPRSVDRDEDQRLAQELLASEKDHAENVMIVDLMRNDLSRVCAAHTVKVPQLCGLESYATVHHLVSVVVGQLQDNLTAIDLLRATFPGGSITGAPKIRAMEIINAIEPTVRGPYCGSIGYIGFNGDMDCSITIRTFAIKNNVVTYQVGGAVVVDSDPADEYAETLTKAQAMLKALTV